MSTLHPQWQSTDDDERSVHITTVDDRRHETASTTRTPVRASRKPAAIAGIALILAVAFFWSGGASNVESLFGQLSTSVTVTITPNGVNPETISVTPGQTITWTNNDTIPHILSSDTLPTGDGQPFMTSAIFPGSSTHFLVPQNAPAGTYEYISKTAQNISGHIVIQGGAVATTSQPAVMQQSSTAPLMPPPMQATSQPDVSQTPSIPAAVSDVSQSSSSSAAPAAAGMLPENPHTVGTEPSLPTRQQPGTVASVASHTPSSEPTTGPDVMIVVALSIAGLLWISRKSLGFSA